MSNARASAGDGAPPEFVTDLLNRLAAIEPGTPLAELRAQRSEIVRYIQGSYAALLEPEPESGLSRIERGVVALRVAHLSASALLAQHYREHLARLDAPAELVAVAEDAAAGASLTARMRAILEHVDLVTNSPHAATQAHLVALQAHGLSTRDIVTLAQLIAFLTFQIRVLAGLQSLAEAL